MKPVIPAHALMLYLRLYAAIRGRKWSEAFKLADQLEAVMGNP